MSKCDTSTLVWITVDLRQANNSMEQRSLQDDSRSAPALYKSKAQ